MKGRACVVHWISRCRAGNLLRRSPPCAGSCWNSTPPLRGPFPQHFKCDLRHGQLYDFSTHKRSFSSFSTGNATESNELPNNNIEIQAVVHHLQEMIESKSPCSPQEVHLVLKRLESQQIRPSFECYYLSIECLCRTKRKGSEEHLDELLQQLQQSFRSTPYSTESKQKLQAAMMHTLRAYHHVSNAHRAEELLVQFMNDSNDPLLVTMEMCKSVLSTWSRSDSSRRARRAESFLSIMHKEKALPDPDIPCYTLVLNCWASSNKENSARRAELLLRSMELSEKLNLRPNMFSYTCVLNAWARSQHSDAPGHAERLFREMCKTKGWAPDRIVYTAMISTWGRAKVPESILKAEKYFKELNDLEKQKIEREGCDVGRNLDSMTTATVVEYSALIQAWANYVDNHVEESRRAVDRVEALLDELMEKYFDASLRELEYAEMFRPNRMTFASVFRTINSARRIPNRGERADSVFRKMHKVKLEPNAHILGLVEKCTRSSLSPPTKQRSGKTFSGIGANRRDHRIGHEK